MLKGLHRWSHGSPDPGHDPPPPLDSHLFCIHPSSHLCTTCSLPCVYPTGAPTQEYTDGRVSLPRWVCPSISRCDIYWALVGGPSAVSTLHLHVLVGIQVKAGVGCVQRTLSFIRLTWLPLYRRPGENPRYIHDITHYIYCTIQ